MSLSTEKLPNNPITGSELRQLCVTLLRDELQIHSVPDECAAKMIGSLDSAMHNDYVFGATIAHPGIQFELRVKLHRSGSSCAFEMTPLFRLQHTAPVIEHVVSVRSPAIPPLAVRSDEEQVEAFTLSMKIENPNLVRVHYGIPIIRQIREEPKPGEMFGQFRTETLEYNPDECGPKPMPSVLDESEQYERMWGVKKEVVPTDAERPKTVAQHGTSVTVAAESSASDSAAAPKHHGKRKGWNKTQTPQS